MIFMSLKGNQWRLQFYFAFNCVYVCVCVIQISGWKLRNSFQNLLSFFFRKFFCGRVYSCYMDTKNDINHLFKEKILFLRSWYFSLYFCLFNHIALHADTISKIKMTRKAFEYYYTNTLSMHVYRERGINIYLDRKVWRVLRLHWVFYLNFHWDFRYFFFHDFVTSTHTYVYKNSSHSFFFTIRGSHYIFFIQKSICYKYQ